MRVRVFVLFLIAAAAMGALIAKRWGAPKTRLRTAITRSTPTLEQALTEKGLRLGSPVFMRIFKESAELEVWIEKEGRFHPFRTYDICNFSGEFGPKLRQGDRQAPEGFYFVPPGRMNPASKFHLAFNLGYPNAYDRHHGRTGSALMVHGGCASIGCYAMTDKGIEEIYVLADAALEGGQEFFRVHAFPFRVTSENMRKYEDSSWYPFWENLKEGYDFFERTGRPPDVEVRDGLYVFEDS